MLTDLYRNQISLGEINRSPSMVEPARVYTIGELLARPDLILSSRSGYSEDTYDPEDPSSWDRLHDPEDIPDNFDFEVPRDPDLYNPPVRPRSPRKSEPSAVKKPAEAGETAPTSKSGREESGSDMTSEKAKNERSSEK